MAGMKRIAAAMATWILATGIAGAEPIKLGMLKTTGVGPVFIAAEKGYFAAEGIPAELAYFGAGPQVAVAAVSGAIDFGIVGISGGLYALAGKGGLRIIAGGYRDVPGFPLFALGASDRAFAAGLKSYKDLPGHLYATTAMGSPGHYALGLIVEKFGLPLASIQIVATQSTANSLSAIAGGRVDAGINFAADFAPLFRDGSAHLIGYPGEEQPWQLAVVFTATASADRRSDTVERFLRAYRKGAREYHDAFVGPDGGRREGPGAAEALAIVGKYIGEPVDQLRQGIAFVDADARLDVADVRHQIAWFRAQGMVKGEVDADAVIDKRYVVPLPQH